MRAVFVGAALAAFVVTPALADHYIVQEPTTKRCRIVEERPASPGIGVVIGGAALASARRPKAVCVPSKNAEKAARPAAAVSSLKRSVNGFAHAKSTITWRAAPVRP